jgi:cell division protein FtsB
MSEKYQKSPSLRCSHGRVNAITDRFSIVLLIQNSKLKTQNSKLKTQNSKLKTQNSKLKTQNSKLSKEPG